ncbi:hypothetical protein Q361_10478 [Flavobacterium croceum DSM 17960]|uniref:Polysaccharide deacetylase n=1 Tax=Flavobacterium croceum DSM 17960 TaxID=1121886 RepID=A0A2S4N9I2_9FLAO|nr:hypothetical protein [Flavobacterium croceum]POS02359.1 hypothetical protein Q361_10478 [Flavobacterium croceum DSM 17960]
MMPKIPLFLTIDTEEDNSWIKPTNAKTHNVENLYRFQLLCEKYNIKPIYLVNYLAASNKKFQEFINIHKTNLEIGLHLHAWNTPPKFDLTANDLYYQPYLFEYPKEIIDKKIDFTIKLLQDTFQTDIVSHRGGRYGISEQIFESLAKQGIKIDCSVVPGFNWTNSLGDPLKKGGVDFTNYPQDIYEIYPNIIEIPVTTYIPKLILNSFSDNFILKRALNKLCNKKKLILRSSLNNISDLKKIIDVKLESNAEHLDYIIHSSELVKGTSSIIKNEQEEALFYKNLEEFFIYVSTKNIQSITFKDYLKDK